MTAVESALLALTAAAIHAEAPTDPKLSASDWMELFRLADRHKLLPLTADAAAPLPSLRAAVQNGLDWNKILSAVFTQVNSQMIQEKSCVMRKDDPLGMKRQSIHIIFNRIRQYIDAAANPLDFPGADIICQCLFRNAQIQHLFCGNHASKALNCFVKSLIHAVTTRD